MDKNSDFLKYLKRPTKNDDDLRSNANINSENPMGAMLQYGAAMSKKEFLNDIPQKFSRAHQSGFIHIHDLDFYDLTTTCCHISLDKLFTTGFGNMRPTKRVQSAFMQLCIAIQSNQNDQYGGQSIIDYDIALGKLAARVYKQMCEDAEYAESQIKEIVNSQIEQGAESMIHNLNTMNSRAGAQVPFSSINYGLAPAMFERMGMSVEAFWAEKVIQATFKATMRGLANGETPRYPIQIYRVKKGINAFPGEPYYHITEYALACTARRAYPNYIFIDNAGNDERFELLNPFSHVGTMGCRTRVYTDLFGESTSYGRGNASFCTINLPRLGILSKSATEFWSRLNYTISLVGEQLKYRLTRQSKRSPSAYPSLVGDEMGCNAYECKKEGNMWPMLQHFTLGVGFIGLWECINALKRNGVTLDPLRIIQHLNFKVNRLRATKKLNYSLLATPAEGLCERFLKLDVKRFGVISGVTDKEYYTNSFHVPVSENISIFEKLDREAPYHRLCNGGAISYVEIDGDVTKNPVAMKTILEGMINCGIGYGAFNIPLDHCTNCHYDGYISGDTCPSCGYSGENIVRMRRITGYLAYVDRFNDGKRAEEQDRVKHSL